MLSWAFCAAALMPGLGFFGLFLITGEVFLGEAFFFGEADFFAPIFLPEPGYANFGDA
jgi:hypothetical protein